MATVERLLVRLTGDATSYMKMWEDAKKLAAQASASIVQAGGKMAEAAKKGASAGVDENTAAKLKQRIRAFSREITALKQQAVETDDKAERKALRRTILGMTQHRAELREKLTQINQDARKARSEQNKLTGEATKLQKKGAQEAQQSAAQVGKLNKKLEDDKNKFLDDSNKKLASAVKKRNKVVEEDQKKSAALAKKGNAQQASDFLQRLDQQEKELKQAKKKLGPRLKADDKAEKEALAAQAKLGSQALTARVQQAKKGDDWEKEARKKRVAQGEAEEAKRVAMIKRFGAMRAEERRKQEDQAAKDVRKANAAFARDMKQHEAQQASEQKAASKAFGRDMAEAKKIADAKEELAEHGAEMMTSFLEGMIRVARASVEEFAKFNLALTESTSIMDVTTEQMRSMEKEALDLSTKSARAPADLAKGFYFLASAGMDTEQALRALPAVLDFATAGAFDLAKATNLAANAQTALGMRAKDSEQNYQNLVRITDVLIKADTLASATAEEFSRALTSQAGASAKMFGKGPEETLSILMAMADTGLKGEKAGTNMSRFIRLLSKSVFTNAEKHKEFGFEVFDKSTGQMREFSAIIKNLEDILSGASDELKAFTMAQLGFDARIQQAIFPLIGMSDNIKRYRAELDVAGSTSKSVAEKQMKAFANQMQMINNQITVAAIMFGKELAPMVIAVGKAVGTVVKVWTDADDVFKSTAATLYTIVAAATATALAMRLLAGSAVMATKAIEVFWVSLVATPAGKFIIAVGLAVGAVVALDKATGDTSKKMGELKESMEGVTKASERLAKAEATAFGKKVTKALEIEDVDKRRDALKKLEEETKDAVLDARRRIEEVEDRILTLRNRPDFWTMGTGEFINHMHRINEERATKAMLEEGKSRRESELAKVRDELAKLSPEALKAKIDTEYLTFLGDLEKAIRNVGKSEREQKIDEFMKAGLAAGQVANLIEKLDELENKKAMKKLGEDVDKLTESLREEADAFDPLGKLSDAQKKVLEMRARGATPEQLATAVEMANKITAQKEHLKLMEEAKKVIEESRTPLEKYAAEVQKYDDMRAAGLLTEEQYAKAVMKSRGELEKTNKELEKIEGSKLGSAEHFAKILRQLELTGPLKPLQDLPAIPREPKVRIKIDEPMATIAELEKAFKDHEFKVKVKAELFNEDVDFLKETDRAFKHSKRVAEMGDAERKLVNDMFVEALKEFMSKSFPARGAPSAEEAATFAKDFDARLRGIIRAFGDALTPEDIAKLKAVAEAYKTAVDPKFIAPPDRARPLPEGAPPAPDLSSTNLLEKISKGIAELNKKDTVEVKPADLLA